MKLAWATTSARRWGVSLFRRPSSCLPPEWKVPPFGFGSFVGRDDLGAPLGCCPISPPKIGFFSNGPGPGRRVTLPAAAKSPKRRRRTAQNERSALIFAFPPVPHYGGRSPGRLCIISGAQNLSNILNSCRATGPWVCKNCHRCGSASAPGFADPTEPVRTLAGGPRGPPLPNPARPPCKRPTPPVRGPIPPLRGKCPEGTKGVGRWPKAKGGRGGSRRSRVGDSASASGFACRN